MSHVWNSSPRVNTDFTIAALKLEAEQQRKKRREYSSIPNIIHSDTGYGTPTVYVLVPPSTNGSGDSSYYPIANLEMLKQVIREVVENVDPRLNVRIMRVSAATYATRAQLKREGFDFSYDPNDEENARYMIPKGSPIITVGDALYAVTRTDELEVDRFMDLQFNDPWFYSPQYGSVVFPTASLNEVCADCYEKIHFRNQLKTALTCKIYPHRPIKLNKRVVTLEEFLQLPEIVAAKTIAIDTETTGLKFTKDRVLCITASVSSSTGYYIDTSTWLENDERWLRFGEAVKDKKQVYANGQFDVKFFRKHGIPKNHVHIDWDVVNCDHALNELATHNGLKTLTWLHTQYGGYNEEFKAALQALKKVDDLPEELVVDYAIMDAIVTYQVYVAQEGLIDRIDSLHPNHIEGGWTLRQFYERVMLPAINMFSDVEYRGMLIDVSKIEQANVALSQRADDLVSQIKTQLNVRDPKFNIDSGVQLGSLLAEQGWPCVQKAKEGYYLTNDFCLQRWSSLGYKAADLLMEYRTLKTLLKTYVGSPESTGQDSEYVQYDLDGEEIQTGKSVKATGYYQYLQTFMDGTTRVHPSFWVMLADSMRNKCSDPNLQNVPKRGPNAELIRSYFTVPGPDWLFGEWDAAGLQLRIAGIISGDLEMRKAFMDPVIKGDLHSVTAHAVFKRDITLEEFLSRLKSGDKEIKALRQKAKAVNFSLLFNTTGFAFAHSILEKEWTLDECKQYVAANELRDLQQLYSKRLLDDHKKDSLFPTPQSKRDFAYYWAVASDIKKKFFEKYTGLKAWLEDYQNFAKQNGYIRSVFGAFRHLPQLTYEGKDTLQGKWKNLLNITANTSVQTYEAVLMMTAMSEMAEIMESKGMRSCIVGNVHDSCPMYIHKSELQAVKDLIVECFEKDRPENQGIPLTSELDTSDIFAGEVW